MALLLLWNFQTPNESPESVFCYCFSSIGMVSSAIAISGINCDWEDNLCYLLPLLKAIWYYHLLTILNSVALAHIGHLRMFCSVLS